MDDAAVTKILSEESRANGVCAAPGKELGMAHVDRSGVCQLLEMASSGSGSLMPLRKGACGKGVRMRTPGEHEFGK